MEMVVATFIIILMTYVVAFWSAVRHGFCRAKVNGTVLFCGAVLLLAMWLGIWYFMVRDWPMNIGGKPQQSFYHGDPAQMRSIGHWIEANVNGIGWGLAVLTFILLLSYVYAGVRIWR